MVEQRLSMAYVIRKTKKRFMFCTVEHCDLCGCLFSVKKPNAFYMIDWGKGGVAFQGLFCASCVTERKMLGIYKDVYPVIYVSTFPEDIIPFILNKPSLKPASSDVWSPTKHNCEVIDKTKCAGRPEYTIDGFDSVKIGSSEADEKVKQLDREIRSDVESDLLLLQSQKGVPLIGEEKKKKVLK